MPALELVVGEGQHPAIGVMDQDDLLSPEQALGDAQRANLIVCDHAAGGRGSSPLSNVPA
jgi:hypothetical protein